MLRDGILIQSWNLHRLKSKFLKRGLAVKGLTKYMKTAREIFCIKIQIVQIATFDKDITTKTKTKKKSYLLNIKQNK